MPKLALIALLWAGSVAGAWFLGGGGRGAAESPSAPAVDRPGAPADAPGARSETTRAAPTLAGDAHAATRPAGGASAAGDGASVGVAPATLSLDGVATPAEASARMLSYAEARLAEGPEGHLALLKALDGLIHDESMQTLFGSEEEAARWIYPWIKFAVLHDQQVAAMTETIFRTMAERPQELASVDDDTLEFFVEGVPYALPAILPQDRLDALRAHAKRILDTPESEQPESVRKNRRRLPRAMAVWAPPTSPEDALARLKAGDLDPREAMALLRRVPADALSQVDVVSILGPMVEQGDHEVFRVLRGLRLDRAQIGGLDARLVAGSARLEPWWIAQYLQVTGRRAWADARPLIDLGLRAGGDRADRFAQALPNLPERPPVEYVQEVLRTTTLSEQSQSWLRNAFGLPR